MSAVEIVSDVLVSIGALTVIAAFALVWWPLGVLGLGLALIALGLVFAKAAKKKQGNS